MFLFCLFLALQTYPRLSQTGVLVKSEVSREKSCLLWPLFTSSPFCLSGKGWPDLVGSGTDGEVSWLQTAQSPSSWRCLTCFAQDPCSGDRRTRGSGGPQLFPMLTWSSPLCPLSQSQLLGETTGSV